MSLSKLELLFYLLKRITKLSGNIKSTYNKMEGQLMEQGAHNPTNTKLLRYLVNRENGQQLNIKKTAVSLKVSPKTISNRLPNFIQAAENIITNYSFQSHPILKKLLFLESMGSLKEDNFYDWILEESIASLDLSIENDSFLEQAAFFQIMLKKYYSPKTDQRERAALESLKGAKNGLERIFTNKLLSLYLEDLQSAVARGEPLKPSNLAQWLLEQSPYQTDTILANDYLLHASKWLYHNRKDFEELFALNALVLASCELIPATTLTYLVNFLINQLIRLRSGAKEDKNIYTDAIINIYENPICRNSISSSNKLNPTHLINATLLKISQWNTVSDKKVSSNDIHNYWKELNQEGLDDNIKNICLKFLCFKLGLYKECIDIRIHEFENTAEELWYSYLDLCSYFVYNPKDFEGEVPRFKGMVRRMELGKINEKQVEANQQLLKLLQQLDKLRDKVVRDNTKPDKLFDLRREIRTTPNLVERGWLLAQFDSICGILGL